MALDAYPWHAEGTPGALPAVDSLAQRFSPPAGFARAPTAPETFGGWLRSLPLAAAGTPVLAYDGRQLLAGDHQHVAAVTTLDVGTSDLQQCADAIMRLHGEWLWHRGRADEASYPTGAGPIPWARYRAGGHPTPRGVSFVWTTRGARKNDHPSYRRYLDVVFSWSNTVAIANKAARIERDEVRPGDFFVLPGSPGHAVLILDLAEHADGRKVALLGQSYMPAQSFQVLRPSRESPWFSLDDEAGVDTPFWPRFPWSSLRRLPP